MPAQATGAPRWSARQKRWVARVSMPDGTRQPFPLPLTIERDDKAGAIAMAKLVAQRVRELGAVAATEGETVNEWFVRWLAAREKKLSSTANDKGRYWRWIAPVIGTKPIAAVTKRDLEGLVETLDAAVLEATCKRDDLHAEGKDVPLHDFKWKTAINVWGVASKMFADASGGKVLSLRAREDNPARDVRGPDRGAERSGPYLFPAEYEAIMQCARVPSRWKRLITLATYCYVRAGELAALEWSSVNFEQRYVHVHCELNRHGKVKPTKAKDKRKVPIESSLVPLLERMHADANGEGRVVTAMPPREELAKRLRRYVKWALADAGLVIRDELLANDETRRPLTWHDLRHTGITWRAVRGDAPKKVQRAAGHSDLRTTDIYINEAETFESAETFGTPFPPLDVAVLTGEPNWAGSGQPTTSVLRTPQDQRSSGASPTGFEHDESAPTSVVSSPRSLAKTRPIVEDTTEDDETEVGGAR